MYTITTGQLQIEIETNSVNSYHKNYSKIIGHLLTEPKVIMYK